MNKTLFWFAFIALLLALFLGCGKNDRARTHGETMEIHLNPSEKVLDVDWEHGDMWILTIDTITHTYFYREKGNSEKAEGTVIIK